MTDQEYGAMSPLSRLARFGKRRDFRMTAPCPASIQGCAARGIRQTLRAAIPCRAEIQVAQTETPAKDSRGIPSQHQAILRAQGEQRNDGGGRTSRAESVLSLLHVRFADLVTRDKRPPRVSTCMPLRRLVADRPTGVIFNRIGGGRGRLASCAVHGPHLSIDGRQELN